ncbi:conjugal transfer protein TraG N-terminal domain-containing protein [Halomonas sp. LBP4]|uniref:conjugal transfer protein TraG N-terminal domain-containing protein n=1 Tax=Halomonas sp. LBP4 TaxID=2044917 RepID=UPI0015E8C689|nr:conjugal transfer protein TraG N-terminal domain-containing protein [Halomonas sp. LBP4]
MFTIYSIGDSAFLEQILIAISMITGTGDFEQMVGVGLLIGVLIMAFQSLFQGGQKIPFQQILVCWIIYACAFGPSSTVVIEDAYTGDARVVANVPVGVGAAGGIISNVGYSITRMFETGYGPIAPGITNSYFADALKLLNDARRSLADPEVFQALNEANGGGYVNIRQSIMNYIQECTLLKIDRGEVTIDELMRTHITPAMRFNSAVYGTQIYDTPGNQNGSYYNCSDGHLVLEAMLDKTNDSQVQQAVSTVLSRDPTYMSASGQINDAMQALGIAASSAQNYMKTAIIEPLYYDAASGKYQEMRDYTSAIMVNQAIQQRNTQWAAEQSMFMSIVRPMLTFIEGFVYAITPFMAFLIVLGGFGIKLVSKYGQMLLWTQLWMPVLSIVNLFLYMSASNEMASYSMDTMGLYSFYALDRSSDILENWIATGGMLAAATPILTLVLVTGSSYAMTSLAGRMQGADHVNEKQSTPDAMTNGAVMANMPSATQDPTSGLRATGADQAVGSMKIGSQLSSSLQSAEQHMESAQQKFGASLSNAITAGGNQTQSYERMSSLGSTVSSMGGQSSTAISEAAADFRQQYGIDAKHQSAIEGAMTVSASGGGGLSLPAGLFSAGGQVANMTKDSDSNTYSMSQDQVDGFLNKAGFTEQNRAELTQGLTDSFAQANKDQMTATWGAQNASQIQSSAEEASTATQSYSEMQSLGMQFNSDESHGYMYLSNNILDENNPGGREAMSQLQTSMMHAPQSVRAEAAERADVLEDVHGMPSANAQVVAQLEALSNQSNYDTPQEYMGAFNDTLRIVGSATGRDFGAAGDATANQKLADSTPAMDGSVTDDVGSRIQGVGASPSGQTGVAGFQGQAASARPDAGAAVEHNSNVSPVIQSDYDAKTGRVEGAAQGFYQEQVEQRLPDAEHVLNTDAGDPGKAVARQDRLGALLDTAGEAGADFMMNLSGTNPMVLGSIQEKLENGEALENIPQMSDYAGTVSEEVALAAVGRANGDNSHYESLSPADQGRVLLAEAATNIQGAEYRDVTQEQQQQAFEAMVTRAEHEFGLSQATSQYYAAQFVDGEGSNRYREHGQEALRAEYMHNTGKTPEQLTEQDEKNIESIGARIENAALADGHADSVLAPVDRFYDLHTGGAAFGQGHSDVQIEPLEQAPAPAQPAAPAPSNPAPAEPQPAGREEPTESMQPKYLDPNAPSTTGGENELVLPTASASDGSSDSRSG